jgi:hypothetical protein
MGFSPDVVRKEKGNALFQQKEIQKAVPQCYTTTPLSAHANPCTFPTDPTVILNWAIIHPL